MHLQLRVLTVFHKVMADPAFRKVPTAAPWLHFCLKITRNVLTKLAPFPPVPSSALEGEFPPSSCSARFHHKSGGAVPTEEICVAFLCTFQRRPRRTLRTSEFTGLGWGPHHEECHTSARSFTLNCHWMGQPRMLQWLGGSIKHHVGSLCRP